MWSLDDRLKRLERKLGLPAAPCPFYMSPKTLCRRVKITLSVEKQERKCYMRHKLRLAAVFVAAAMALTGTAIAAGPALNETLRSILGPFLLYSQPLTGVTQDQGIQFKLLSAVTDGSVLKVYGEVSDLTDDRLKNAHIEGNLSLYTAKKSISVSGTETVNYDPESKTATICMSLIDGALISGGSEGVAALTLVQPEYHPFHSAPIPVEHIPHTYLDTQLQDGKSVLKPNQNPLELANSEGVAVSSMGFTADGRLHFLFRFPEGTLAEKAHSILTIYTGEDEVPFQGYQNVFFLQDGTAYYDHSVTASLTDLARISSLTGAYGFYVAAPKVSGSWNLPFQVQQVKSTVSPLSGVIDHHTLRDLTLSPLSVVITSTSDDLTIIGGYPLTVFLSDGSRLHPSSAPHGASAHQEYKISQWEFAQPVDVSQITGAALGCWMIPIENGAAGEGYWLPALPE